MPLNFADLNLSPEIQAGVSKAGFVECTPIQEQTIPPVLEGKDVAGLAQTGTGKTAAFLLPLMDRIVRSTKPADANETPALQARRFADWQRGNFILILVPTRELAEQVYENTLSLRGEAKIESVSIYGGVAYDRQKQAIREGVQFIVATPGRLIDLYKEHIIDLRQVRAIVFDEADRMFDMGFKDDMKFILQRVPKDRQFLVFSATLNFDVINTAYQFGAHPVECDVSRDQPKAENVDDRIFHVGHTDKPQLLLSIFRKHSPHQAIIFSNFKNNVARITAFLNSNDLPSVGISSLLTQAQRNRVMEQFKGSSNRNILVATDVAARGLDIKGVDLIVNFELPDDPENYVHRIGRTGRAGQKGLALSLVSDRDVDAMARIEDYLQHKLAVDWVDDTDLVKEFKSFPSERDLERFGPNGAKPRSSAPQQGRGDGPRGPRHDRGPRRDFPRRDKPQSGRPEFDMNGEPRAQSRPPQHRDRLTGRHGGRGRDQAHRSDGQRADGRDGHRQSGGGNQPHRNRPRTDRARPTGPRLEPRARVATPASSSSSFGKKVSGFFKKLFGG